jgi:mono/diheme cytochrome c family protein
MTDIGARTARTVSSVALGAALAGCAAGVGTTTATATDVRDLERGRTLYDNNCRVCHTSKVHRRVPQLPVNHDELRLIVLTWVRFEGLQWSSEDIDDVVFYVNRTYYQFDK